MSVKKEGFDRAKQLASEGFELVDAFTVCVVQKCSNGRVEEEMIDGTPKEVKEKVAPMVRGQVARIGHVWTWETWTKEIHANTTGGVIKKRITEPVQYQGFGSQDGDVPTSGRRSPETASNGSNGFPDEPMPPEKEGEGKVDVARVFKNWMKSTNSHVLFAIGLGAIAAMMGFGALLVVLLR